MSGQYYQPPPQYPPQQYPQQYGPRYEFGDQINRFVALIIDGILIGVIGTILTWVIAIAGFVVAGWLGYIVSLLVITVLLALYSPLMESMPKGATIGKQIMKLRVVNEQYQPVSFGTAFIRNLSKFLWWTGIVFIIDVLLVLTKDTRQHLGDIMAHCYVVNDQPQQMGPPPYYAPPQGQAPPPQYQQPYPPQQQYQAPPPPPQQTICPGCGQTVRPEYNACPYCGKHVVR